MEQKNDNQNYKSKNIKRYKWCDFNKVESHNNDKCYKQNPGIDKNSTRNNAIILKYAQCTPIAEAKINGIKHHVLFDSGSEKTFIRSQIVSSTLKKNLKENENSQPS
ncbi:hypothetical protein DMUE_3918 [Dictyocoela muelleri]|nr:hypothetical protein DMUE_3918 [Dictyocoela muelleri]